MQNETPCVSGFVRRAENEHASSWWAERGHRAYDGPGMIASGKVDRRLVEMARTSGYNRAIGSITPTCRGRVALWNGEIYSQA